KILDAARRALELQRDYATEVIIPEVINQFEQDYKPKWDETEDLAKNTLQTAQQEANEQNRRLDSRTMLLTASQAVGLTVDLRADRGAELSERDILGAVRTAFDARVVDQIARRLEKRVGVDLPLEWSADENLNFDALRGETIQSYQDAYNKQADKYLADIERELSERVKSIDDVRGMRLSNLMFGISHTRHAIFDQRSHRRGEILIPRFTWVHQAAEKIKGMPQAQLREEILAYWNQSLDLLEPLRGGAQAFNDMLRELMLSVVTNLWVDYLTDIEALRQGIGLQAFGQRDPLVEYKRRAFEMFQDLYRRIRSQVVSNVFTYQYRGFAKLEEEDRDRASRKAIEAPRQERAAVPAVAKSAPQPKSGGAERQKEAAPSAPPRASAGAASGKLGRNDPCWCGSGKKYKNCHMQSDMGQGAPTHMAGNGKRRR
ncbi:MAG: SEC-C metal-binding domain-containing protein, partial [Acidobacteriota bacterium]